MFVIKVVINLQLMVMAYSSKNFKTFSSNFTINTPPKNQFFFLFKKRQMLNMANDKQNCQVVCIGADLGRWGWGGTFL